MAQKGVELDPDAFCCSICLDLLKNPVTVPCGHSYCMDCIKSHWDQGHERKIHSCPQCRQAFTPRPVLVRNTMLAVLVEGLKKTGLEAAAAADDHCYAGAEDMACDFCTGRKLKAVKSCLQCLASYCEKHLQPHYQSPTFNKHKLVEPLKTLQENVCSRHNEVMKLFCRTDQQCICYLCSVEEHKSHDTVSAETEHDERQRELNLNRQRIQERIRDKEKGVKALQKEAEAISHSADVAVWKTEEMFIELNRLIEERRRDLRQQIRSQQETQVKRVKEMEKKLEQEITELRRTHAELEKLTRIEDHNQFLRNYPSLSNLIDATDSFSIDTCPLRYFQDVTAAVSELPAKLQHSLSEEWTDISLRLTQVDVLLSKPLTEPRTRADFLKYSCKITLDPNTVNTQLSLSEGNKRVTHVQQKQKYPPHRERFPQTYQVLSRESLTGRCYWEVDWSGEGRVCVAVTYNDINRYGEPDCLFGYNNKSWALYCFKSSYSFWCGNGGSSISGPVSSRIGVYQDHRAGILSFYSVSETMTLLHRVHTTFTQPLYVGLWLPVPGDTIHFCPLGV